jgi:hypothetical protein
VNFQGVTEKEQPGMRIIATLSGTVLHELVTLVLTSLPAEPDKPAYY